MIWAIALLFALAAGGLAHVLLQALHSGAEAYSGEFSEDTARQFEDIFLFIPPRRIAELGWTAAVVAAVVVFFATGDLTSAKGFAVGGILGVIAGSLALRAPRLVLAHLRRRRLARFNQQLGDTLVGMSNSLKAGFSIAQAFEAVVRDGEKPIAQEFGLLLQQTRVGVPFSDALANMEGRVGSEDLSLVVTAIEAARRTGGNLTEIFEQIAATIRERVRIQNRIRTLTAQGRLQGIIVGLMPLLIAGALMFVDPGLMLPFLHSGIGVAVLVAVVVLVGTGGLVIRKIVNIDV